MITRKDIAAHLEKQVILGMLRSRSEYTPLRSTFTREVTGTGAFEIMADLGDQPWPRLGAGKQGAGGTDGRTSAPVVNQMTAGQPIVYTDAEERALMVYPLYWYIAKEVSHAAINQDRSGDLEAWARAGMINFQRHIDFLCFDALNSGEATTNYGAGYDGLSFYNDSHVDPGAEYTTVQDNKYASTLTLDNFETVRVAASNFKDSRGQPQGYNHNLLIVPPALERVAANITTNVEDYAVANRAMNPYAGNIRSLIAPGGWLDATSWHLLDVSDPLSKPILVFMFQRPQMVPTWDNENIGAGVRYYKMESWYGVAYGNWRRSIQGNT